MFFSIAVSLQRWKDLFFFVVVWRGEKNCKLNHCLLALQTVHEGRIYQLKLFCGQDYPDNPPNVRFQTRINMTCVNPETGVVCDDFVKHFHHNVTEN